MLLVDQIALNSLCPFLIGILYCILWAAWEVRILNIIDAYFKLRSASADSNKLMPWLEAAPSVDACGLAQVTVAVLCTPQDRRFAPEKIEGTPEPCGTTSYNTPSYGTTSYRTSSYRTSSYRIPSYRTPSYRIISYRITSYRQPLLGQTLIR